MRGGNLEPCHNIDPENQQKRSSPIWPKVLKPDTIVIYSPCPKVQKQLMELNVNNSTTVIRMIRGTPQIC